MSAHRNARFAYTSEREALEGFLDYQREGLLLTLEGLDDAAARKAPSASSLSLLGLVKHAATWERRWFQVIMAGRELPENWPAVKTEPRDADLMVDENDTVVCPDPWYRGRGGGEGPVSPLSPSQLRHRLSPINCGT